MQRTIIAAVLALSATATAAPKGLTIEDMLAMQRVGDPVVSPDGKRVVFAVRDTDMDANKGRFDLYLVNVEGDGLTRLTSHPENDTDPQWTPDGKWIYFMSTRSGSPQVWRVSPSGGEAQQVTKLPVEVNGYTMFPDGRRLALAIDVWPDAKSIADSVKRDETVAKAKVKALAFETTLFRHWDQWEDGKYSHVFVWSPDKPDDAKDLTPGMVTDTPAKPHDGMEDIQVSPDGKWIAYVARVGGHEQAWTTNTDIYLVPTTGGKAVDLTTDNKAYDARPTFSPDGKSLALTMMKRPGFESDRQRMAVINLATKQLRVVNESWDRSPDGIEWSRDGHTIYTSADYVGGHAIFSVDVATGKAMRLAEKGTNSAPHVAGERIVYVHDSFKQPAELFTMKPDGTDVRQITHFNDARVKSIDWGDYEQFSFKGAKNDTVYGYVMKPAGWTATKKFPVALQIHGGPQGTFSDHFHYRWNAEVFAGHGYGVVIVDFHGSTGYGQAFTDAITGDWGGAPFEDLMKGLDAALAKNTWLDGNRAVALGASYGGYMINWINGKTDRFKALVCHDGIHDVREQYLTTEEQWFPEWENGGTPWDKPEAYAKFNPIEHMKNWKTPTLVVHGGLDYRITVSDGMGTFTALQRLGVPSRFLYFPDENHWVLKPQNSKRWHDEVFAWIDRYTKKR